MFDFIRKSPFGFVLTAAAVVLALSPEAREAARKAAIKGTAVILDLVDNAKDSTHVEQPALIEYNSNLTNPEDASEGTENKKPSV